MKIEQRILNARSKETNINLIAKLGKIQFLRFVYSAKTGEITTSNVGEQHIIPKFCIERCETKMVKLQRAQGECLGIRGRRRTR